jgi:hypothetical protein
MIAVAPRRRYQYILDIGLEVATIRVTGLRVYLEGNIHATKQNGLAYAPQA